jgi:hypothetical protein
VVVSSPSEFRAAVGNYRFDGIVFEEEVIGLAAGTLAETGLLVVGEPHGAYETPSVLYSLAGRLGTRGIAFEWSHEELDEAVQRFVRSGSFDFERLWSLPPSAEFFCGDGRFTTGHFALLQRLRDEGRLDQAIVYDRLDPVPDPDDWRIRDRELAERLLGEWDERTPLLVLTGAFHATLAEGTMAAELARARPGLRPAMLEYQDRPAMPEAPITLPLPIATPAVVPGFKPQSIGEKTP